MLNKLLVPLDGSATSETGIEPAINLARPNKGKVILLHSLIPVHTMMPVFADEYAWIWPAGSLEWSRQQAAKYLKSVADKWADAGVELRTRLVEAQEAAAILDVAAEEGVDMIIMSAFGHTGLSRWSMGSTTEKVLYSAPCPVLVIRTSKPIHEMVVTLDGSMLAERALEPSMDVACALDAYVTLLRVSRPPFRPEQIPYLEWTDTGESERLSENLHNGAKEYLEAVARRYEGMRPGGEPIRTVVLEGPPVDEILDYTTEHDTDLIGLSTHGRTGLRRWIYGSIAARVLRGSTCNVMVVRPPLHELA